MSSLPVSRAVATARSISERLAIPVEMMIGFPVSAIARIRGRSTISLEATL